MGRIGEERFDTLLAGYEQEQTALRQSIMEAESALDSFEQDTANVERFLALRGFKFFPTAFADQLERLADRVFAGLDLLIAFPALDPMPVQGRVCHGGGSGSGQLRARHRQCGTLPCPGKEVHGLLAERMVSKINVRRALVEI